MPTTINGPSLGNSTRAEYQNLIKQLKPKKKPLEFWKPEDNLPPMNRLISAADNRFKQNTQLIGTPEYIPHEQLNWAMTEIHKGTGARHQFNELFDENGNLTDLANKYQNRTLKRTAVEATVVGTASGIVGGLIGGGTFGGLAGGAIGAGWQVRKRYKTKQRKTKKAEEALAKLVDMKLEQLRANTNQQPLPPLPTNNQNPQSPQQAYYSPSPSSSQGVGLGATSSLPLKPVSNSRYDR